MFTLNLVTDQVQSRAATESVWINETFLVTRCGLIITDYLVRGNNFFKILFLLFGSNPKVRPVCNEPTQT